ncbi:MAG: hypothetical protein HDQ88_04995 [Clostridia bacterium]|nr:hypothetical protein [Clostridia bacterium]
MSKSFNVSRCLEEHKLTLLFANSLVSSIGGDYPKEYYPQANIGLNLINVPNNSLQIIFDKIVTPSTLGRFLINKDIVVNRGDVLYPNKTDANKIITISNIYCDEVINATPGTLLIRTLFMVPNATAIDKTPLLFTLDILKG